ncbi:MAG: hypothetical protein V7603_5225 [Micromonosporaceae bacterium]
MIAVLVGVLAAAGVAACGNRSNPVNIVQQNDNSGGGGGPDPAFLDCLRSHGMAVPTAFPSRFPRPSGSRRPRPSGFPRASGFPRPSGSDFRRPGGPFRSIPAACASLRPPPPRSPQLG